MFKIANTVDYCLKALLLFAIVVAFVPLTPKLPATDLDSAWALALNEAVAKGFTFGKQIIFTLGPYSSIYTKSYHPATVIMMIAGSFYLALSYYLCLLYLTQDTPKRWILAFTLLLIGMLCSRDALLLSYPLIAGLTACKLPFFRLKETRFRLLILLIFMPLGLLSLIKGTLFLLSAFVSIVCCVFLLTKKHYAASFLCLISPLLSMVLFWTICGQSLDTIIDYSFNTLYMASAFTEAMSTKAPLNEVLIYLVSACCIVGSVLSQKPATGYYKATVSLLYLSFLFMAFKAGFTRHYGHIFIAETALIIAAFLLPFIHDAKKVFPTVILALISAQYLGLQNANLSFTSNAQVTYSSFFNGLGHWINNKNWLWEDYALSMQYLKNQAHLPIVIGKTDIYSYDQTYLIASGNSWSPRPVFQSYSVFNAYLAKKNTTHLEGSNAPDTVFFKLQAIDNKMPSLEDGASWPIFLVNYTPQKTLGDFLLLAKKAVQKPVKYTTQTVRNRSVALGDKVAISTSDLVFAKIDLEPTLWGRLLLFFLGPDKLQLHLQLPNKKIVDYNFIPSMGKSIFLLSPLVENTQEFAQLYTKNKLTEKQVTSFSITTNPKNSWHWQQHYRLELKSVM